MKKTSLNASITRTSSYSCGQDKNNETTFQYNIYRQHYLSSRNLFNLSHSKNRSTGHTEQLKDTIIYLFGSINHTWSGQCSTHICIAMQLITTIDYTATLDTVISRHDCVLDVVIVWPWVLFWPPMSRDRFPLVSISLTLQIVNLTDSITCWQI